MLKISDLVYGQVYSNDEITEAFKCSQQGGMRRSIKTGTLVIFALHHKSLYDDVWDNDIMHYTGMGQEGNQSVSSAQNRTLAESNTNGVIVHLFEGYKDREYIYDGIVELAGKPYEGSELDVNSNTRIVIKFPIRIKKGKKTIPTPDMLASCKKSKEKIVDAIPDDKLKAVAKKAGSKNPKKSSSTTTTYERDEAVSNHTKRRAKGKCDLCDEDAPFKSKGKPYLECHHVKRLADDGPDKIYNTVSLCPNCHRKVHVLNSKKDIQKLKTKIKSYLEADNDVESLKCFNELFGD